MKIELITEFEDFLDLEEEWNAVLKRSLSDNPFLTFQWLKSWLDVFGRDCRLRVITARSESTLAAMAPLVINPDGRLVFIGYPLSDYSDFIAVRGMEEAIDKILDFIFAGEKGWGKAILDQLAQDKSNTGRIEEYLKRKGVPFRTIMSDSCPAMVIDDVETARKMYYKRNITTYVNWYNKQGEFKFNVYEDGEELLSRLEDLFEQHRRRRDLTPFPSQFEKEDVRSFFKTFMGSMHPEGWARLFSLTLNGEFLALYIGFEYNKILYLYTTSFNTDYARRSPGQVILRYLFDYSVDKGIRQMDFARGEESYKDRFSNVYRQNRKVIIYNSAVSKTAADLFFAFRYSKPVDILYRNKRVQNAKYAFLYHSRKRGLAGGVLEGIKALFAR